MAPPPTLPPLIWLLCHAALIVVAIPADKVVDAPAACAPGAYADASTGACVDCFRSTFDYYIPGSGPLLNVSNGLSAVPYILAADADYTSCWALCNTSASCITWKYAPANCAFKGSTTFPTPRCFFSTGRYDSDYYFNPCRDSGTVTKSFSFSYGGSGACSPCAANAVFISATAGCQPTSNISQGSTETTFFFSGSRAEGAGAFAVMRPEGLSYVTDVFGNENGAMAMAAGTSLATAELVPDVLPTEGADRTIAVWVRCPAPLSSSGTRGVGILTFFNGSTPVDILDSERFLVYGNDTNGGIEGLSAVACPDCFRSVVTTLAGNGTDSRGAAALADGPGKLAMFKNPIGAITLDSMGTIYIADAVSRIRAVAASGYTTTIAGNGSAKTVDGIGTNARFNAPRGICLDANENALFISHSATPCIRRMSLLPDRVVSTVAGTCSTPGFVDGVGAEARFGAAIWGLVSDSRGLVFAGDIGNQAVRVISPNYTVSTLKVAIWRPTALALDATQGVLFVCDQLNSMIWGLRIVDAYMLWQFPLSEATGGGSRRLELNGMASDPLRSRLFLTVTDPDSFDGRVIMLDGSEASTPGRFKATTLAGGRANPPGGFLDGNGSGAIFGRLTGIGIDPRSNGSTIIVADQRNQRIRKIDFPFGEASSRDSRVVLPGVCEDNGQRWHHLAFTMEGSAGDAAARASWFVDGALVGTNDNKLDLTMLGLATTALQIGGQLVPASLFDATPSAPFSGAISDLRIFNVALREAELRWMMLPGLPEFYPRYVTGVPPTRPVVYVWRCAEPLVGPVVELRLDALTNGWIWSHAQGHACGPAVAIGSAAEAPLSAGVIAGIALPIVLLALLAGYVALTRLHVRRQLETLTAKTTLASRAMDRARLLQLQATPNAPEFTIDFRTGAIRTVAELLGEAPAPGSPAAAAAAAASSAAAAAAGSAVSAAAHPFAKMPVSPPLGALPQAASSRQLRVTNLLHSVAVAAALAAPQPPVPLSSPPEPPAGPLPERIVEIKWAELVPDLSVRGFPKFGGFGAVFVARWTPKRKLVAVKVLKSAMLSATQSLAAVEMLMHEAQGLMKASDGGVNEHVVQVFGVAQGVAEGWQAAQRAARAAEVRAERLKRARGLPCLKSDNPHQV